MNFEVYATYLPELIVCMGDTITHLDSSKSVKDLLQNSFELLQKEGIFIISFRDLTIELKDENRFILVNSNETMIFTCFLEYFSKYVKVHDIVYKKSNEEWEQKISHYMKLRISKDVMNNTLSEIGVRIIYSDIKNGMVTMICEK